MNILVDIVHHQSISGYLVGTHDGLEVLILLDWIER